MFEFQTGLSKSVIWNRAHVLVIVLCNLDFKRYGYTFARIHLTISECRTCHRRCSPNESILIYMCIQIFIRTVPHNGVFSILQSSTRVYNSNAPLGWSHVGKGFPNAVANYPRVHMQLTCLKKERPPHSADLRGVFSQKNRAWSSPLAFGHHQSPHASQRAGLRVLLHACHQVANPILIWPSCGTLERDRCLLVHDGHLQLQIQISSIVHPPIFQFPCVRIH